MTALEERIRDHLQARGDRIAPPPRDFGVPGRRRGSAGSGAWSPSSERRS